MHILALCLLPNKVQALPQDSITRLLLLTRLLPASCLCLGGTAGRPLWPAGRRNPCGRGRQRLARLAPVRHSILPRPSAIPFAPESPAALPSPSPPPREFSPLRLCASAQACGVGQRGTGGRAAFCGAAVGRRRSLGHRQIRRGLRREVVAAALRRRRPAAGEPPKLRRSAVKPPAKGWAESHLTKTPPSPLQLPLPWGVRGSKGAGRLPPDPRPPPPPNPPPSGPCAPLREWGWAGWACGVGGGGEVVVVGGGSGVIGESGAAFCGDESAAGLADTAAKTRPLLHLRL